MQCEEIFHLGAGNQNCDALVNSDDYRTRNELYRRTQPGEAHDHQQNARHHGEHEQPIHTVYSHDASYYNQEGAGRPDLRL